MFDCFLVSIDSFLTVNISVEFCMLVLSSCVIFLLFHGADVCLLFDLLV